MSTTSVSKSTAKKTSTNGVSAAHAAASTLKTPSVIKAAAALLTSADLVLPPPVTAPVAVAAPAAPRTRLPAGRKVEKQIRLAGQRWMNLARQTQGWSPELDAAYKVIITSVDAALTVARNIPDTFEKPRKQGGGAPRKPLAIGSKVNVTAKALKHYAGIIDEADLQGLTIKRVVGKKIIASLASDNTSVILPRQHVAPAPPTAAAS